jgi:23S rRNA-/tRNA-specific pseudouridylate synthase
VQLNGSVSVLPKKINLQTGDRIFLTLPQPIPRFYNQKQFPRNSFEDDSLIIVNKPMV